SMVDLMANRVGMVRVKVRQLPIPPELVAGNYQEDRAFRARFQQWMNWLWREKDEDMERMLGQCPRVGGKGKVARPEQGAPLGLHGPAAAAKVGANRGTVSPPVL